MVVCAHADDEKKCLHEYPQVIPPDVTQVDPLRTITYAASTVDGPVWGLAAYDDTITVGKCGGNLVAIVNYKQGNCASLAAFMG